LSMSGTGGTSLALEGASPQTGVGITFPATQAASSNANTLDDYEEGTWTPSVVASGGTGSASYNTQSGQYIKIGKMVWANFFINFAKNTLSGGTIQISGLPFTANGTSFQYPEFAILFDNLAAALVNPLAQIGQATSNIDIINGNGSTGVHTGASINTYLNSSGNMQLRGTAVYQSEN
jgi:hypothetical protein